MKRWHWIVARVIVLVSFAVVFWWKLSYDLARDLIIPPVEIPSDCQQTDFGFQCKRGDWNPDTYIRNIKKAAPRLFENQQTLIQRFANISPELFMYSIEVRDESYVREWKNQQSFDRPRNRGLCPLPSGFTFNKNVGTFTQNFGFTQVPEKVYTVVRSLNDCGQEPERITDQEVEKIEEREKYIITVLPVADGLSRTILSVLSLSLTIAVLKIFSVTWRFVEKGIREL